MPILLLLAAAAAFGAIVVLATAGLARSRPVLAAAGRPRWLRARLDPATAAGLPLSLALGAVVIGVLAVVLLAVLSDRSGTLHSIDTGAAVWADEHAGGLSTRLISLVTDLGDWPVVPGIGIAVAILEFRRVRSRSIVPFLVVVALGDQVVTTTIKTLTDRARPTLNPVAATLGPSFPSGHSSTAAAFYAALALVLVRRRAPRTRALVIGGAGAVAVAVAASRVLLDVHWLSDVVAGLALGWAWFALCAILFGTRLVEVGPTGEPVQPEPVSEPVKEPSGPLAPDRPARSSSR